LRVRGYPCEPVRLATLRAICGAPVRVLRAGAPCELMRPASLRASGRGLSAPELLLEGLFGVIDCAFERVIVGE
jgi:hypothetical protein